MSDPPRGPGPEAVSWSRPRPDPPQDGHAPGRDRALRWGLFGLWCAVVLVGTARHEYWRDEVRAYAFARDSHTLAELFGRLKDEGHPALWHLLLYAGDALTGSKLVLPAASLGVAAVAVALLIFRAPLPLWLKALFVLGALPLYEYSVVARNYGISMLLLFVFAAWYPGRARPALALVLGLTLAALANTNVHSLLLACLLMGLWLWDHRAAARTPMRPRSVLGVSMAATTLAIGVLLALATFWPSDQILPSDHTRYTAGHVVGALVAVLCDPAGGFRDLAPRVPGVVVTAILANIVFAWALLGLVGRPALALLALVAVLALGTLFAIVYPGGYRHQGLLLTFLLALYWLRFQPTPATPATPALPARWHGLRIFGGLTVLLGIALGLGLYRLGRDLLYPQSASRAFGELLRRHPDYRGAILLGEPDFLLESVPYYADNPIYIAREQRFGDTIRFTRASQARLGLGELLRTAARLRDPPGARPVSTLDPEGQVRRVLVALGHLPGFDPARGVDPALGVMGSGTRGTDDAAGLRELAYSYGRTFTWSAAELAAWRASTVLVGRFDDHIVGDERYVVYEVIAAPPPPEPGQR